MKTMQDAKSADRSKNEFLTNMSHELRTPLNAMIGFSEIMKEEVLGPAGSQRYKSYATYIFDSGHHLLAMIEDILDIAKIESGNFDLNKTPVSLFDCAVSTIRLDSGRLDGRDVKLLNKVPSNFPS